MDRFPLLLAVLAGVVACDGGSRDLRGEFTLNQGGDEVTLRFNESGTVVLTIVDRGGTRTVDCQYDLALPQVLLRCPPGDQRLAGTLDGDVLEVEVQGELVRLQRNVISSVTPAGRVRAEAAIRRQVAEGYSLGRAIGLMAADYYAVNGAMPEGRSTDGRGSDTLFDLIGAERQLLQPYRFVSAVDMKDGVLALEFGKEADFTIAGRRLIFQPYWSDSTAEIAWICDNRKPPRDHKPLFRSTVTSSLPLSARPDKCK